MFSDESHPASFLREGGDEEFDKAMKGLQEFSCQVIEKNDNKNSEKIDYEANSVIKNLNHYYDNRMNFDKNELINVPTDVTSKLDNLYDQIMESKKDKDMKVNRNMEFLGDPKAIPQKIKANNSKRQSLPAEIFSQPKKGKNTTEKKNYELQRIPTQEQEEDFDASFYEYPVMSTPSIKGSFNNGYVPPEPYSNNNNNNNSAQIYGNLVPGVPVYQMSNQTTFQPAQTYPINQVYPNLQPNYYMQPYGQPQPTPSFFSNNKTPSYNPQYRNWNNNAKY